MSKIAEFIMLVGLPATGKSTWITKFINASDKHYTVICLDDLVQQRCENAGMTYSDGYTIMVNDAVRDMYKIASDAIDNRENIIWDQTNLNIDIRKQKLDMIPDDDYHIVAAIFELDDEERRRRLTSRANETGKHIPSDVIETMINLYEQPEYSEGFHEIIRSTHAS